MRKIIFSVLVVFLSATSFAESSIKSIDKMSLDQKVGQLFFVGFNGKEISPNFKKHLKVLKPGAVIVFGRNIKSLKQIAGLNSDLQQISLATTGVPLFIAVDQEGGGVSRIHTSPAMPSAFTIGQTNDPTLAFQAGKVTGELLSLLGFNMNLAPVLDITDDKLRSFINTRSFSDSPHKIGSMGVAFAHGLSEGKVLPVAKHFPGHGPISLDSHHTTPERHVSLEDLSRADLIPFNQFASAQFQSGIMVAHIAYPKIDKSGLPATFSKTLITDVLKEQLQYGGLILTDDVEMGGAAVFTKLEDRAIAAVNAGNDLIMFGWNQKAQLKAKRAIVRAVKTGKIPIERINQSVQKILAHKEKTLIPQTRSLASLPSIKDSLGKIQLRQAYSDIIAHYFKNLEHLSPAAHQYSGFAVFSLYKPFSTGFMKRLKGSKARLLKSTMFKDVASDELLVFHVSNQKALKIARNLPDNIRKNTLLISTLPKFRFEDKAAFLEVVEIHSVHPEIGGYAAEAINRARTQVSLLDI